MTPGVVVVTGASGFTGPFVVRELLRRFPGATIRCLLRSSSRADALPVDRVEIVRGDLRDAESLVRAFRGADTLMNVASLGFDWTETLCDAIRRSSLERGIFTSTTAILTRLPVMSRARRVQGEAAVRASGLAWTIVRPTMIYGTPGDRNIARLIRFILRSPVIPVVAPDALQQPVHVEDVARALTAALAEPSTVSGEYNIAGRDPLPLRELVRTVARVAGVRRLIVPVPAGPVRAGVAVYGRLVRRPLLTVEQIDRLHEDKAFDYSAAQEAFGYAPRSFEEGVRAEIAMVRTR